MAKGEVGDGIKRSNGLAVVMVLFGIRLPVCRTVGYRTTTLEAHLTNPVIVASLAKLNVNQQECIVNVNTKETVLSTLVWNPLLI